MLTNYTKFLKSQVILGGKICDFSVYSGDLNWSLPHIMKISQYFFSVVHHAWHWFIWLHKFSSGKWFFHRSVSTPLRCETTFPQKSIKWPPTDLVFPGYELHKTQKENVCVIIVVVVVIHFTWFSPSKEKFAALSSSRVQCGWMAFSISSLAMNWMRIKGFSI